MNLLRMILGLCLLLVSLQASAETMVLVQGYMSDGNTWRRSGVCDVLQDAGWVDGGQWSNGPQGVQLSGGNPTSAARVFYTVTLDTEAPLMVQQRQLAPYLAEIRSRHTGESLYLVGHSAGGVLARLYLVQHPEFKVSALITFASPHLGTASAEAGINIGQSLFGWAALLFGVDDLNRSQGLYDDLAREQNGNLLYWLNRQPHPPTRYISVVRHEDGYLGVGDIVVPPWSEDMNNVAALRGRAQTFTVDAPHTLIPADGSLLLQILSRLHSS